MSTIRLAWLEAQLFREDLTEEQWNTFNREANDIQTVINEKKEQQRLIREQKLKDEQEEKELEAVLALTEEQVEKMYEDSCLKYQDVNGISFREWYSTSLKYYNVDAAFNVSAKARSANTVEIIPHPTLAQAKLTILRRIRYKFYDHAVRGHDFAYEIE